jgi:hypothetical protein
MDDGRDGAQTEADERRAGPDLHAVRRHAAQQYPIRSTRPVPGIPIGPHWMVIWPCDETLNSKKSGLPNMVRDAGAWVMFDGTPYAYLHVCGTPWSGNEYAPDQTAIWTMRYGTSLEP